ncbi:hypothetical protein INT47_012985 [Mucor saturninus]|uniref:Uncharacterized protein n=1 Tax=Mucor saturninus TaxID=64648 RepID=A0A8H7QJ35_9FUNG|nr:hypothetical protein INT47_012985 [Mucor saturninus]
MDTTINAIGAATLATNTALNLISATHDTTGITNIHPEVSIKSTEDATASAESYEDEDDEIIIHAIAHKKLSGKLCTDDLNYLKNYKSDGSPKSGLLLLSSKLLQKQKLSVLEEVLLELSLSGIFNYFNPAMMKMYEKELNKPLPEIINNDDDTIQVPKGIISEVFRSISKSENMDQALGYKQLEKAQLSQKNERRSDKYAILSIDKYAILSIDKYAVLSIVKKVIEDTKLWSKTGDEQELTFYRRFSSILDVLFKGTEVILSDGETSCYSSRIAIEANKRVFAGENISPTYSRKIYLLLQYDEKKAIDLCSNEWKKVKVTNDLKLK